MSVSGRVGYELSRGVILVVGDFGFVGGIMCWSRGVFSKCGEYGKNKKIGVDLGFIPKNLKHYSNDYHTGTLPEFF